MSLHVCIFSIGLYKALCVYVCMSAYNLGMDRAIASKFSGLLQGAPGIIFVQ